MRNPTIFLIPLIVIISISSAAIAQPEIYDASGNRDFICEGDDILTIDYLAVWNNGVFEDGSDYPFARIWLILYEPRSYENEKEMDEDDWDRRHEINRYEIPGPSSRGRWENGDETVYRDLGIHDWDEYRHDRLVFRIIVEEPAEAWETDTLMWGTIHEDDTHDTLVFEIEDLRIFFRTLNLPEVFYQPQAEITVFWFEHDVKAGGKDGLQVHIDFEIENLRSYLCRITAFVHYDIGDEPVRCRTDDPAYSDPKGYLTVQQNFVPPYTATTFTDFTLFIPYEVFPVSDRYENYYVDVEILDDNWDLVGSGQSHLFSVHNPG